MHAFCFVYFIPPMFSIYVFIIQVIEERGNLLVWHNVLNACSNKGFHDQ